MKVSGMTDCDQVPPEVIHLWHYVDMSYLRDGEFLQMLRWMEQQPGGSFYWTLIRGVWFEREEDRMFTLLTWG